MEEGFETRQLVRGQPCVAVQIYIEAVPRNHEKAALVQSFDLDTAAVRCCLGVRYDDDIAALIGSFLIDAHSYRYHIQRSRQGTRRNLSPRR